MVEDGRRMAIYVKKRTGPIAKSCYVFDTSLPESRPMLAQTGSVGKMATAYSPQLLSFQTQLHRVRNLLCQSDRKADFSLRSK